MSYRGMLNSFRMYLRGLARTNPLERKKNLIRKHVRVWDMEFWTLYVFRDNIPELKEVFRTIPLRTATFVRFQNGVYPYKAWACLTSYEEQADKLIREKIPYVTLLN